LSEASSGTEVVEATIVSYPFEIIADIEISEKKSISVKTAINEVDEDDNPLLILRKMKMSHEKSASVNQLAPN